MFHNHYLTVIILSNHHFLSFPLIAFFSKLTTLNLPFHISSAFDWIEVLDPLISTVFIVLSSVENQDVGRGTGAFN